MDEAESWGAVVELINNPPASDVEETEEEPEPEEPAEYVPSKEEVVKFQPIDPKTKRPMTNPKTKRPVMKEGEVSAVDKKTRTVTLVDTTDKKTVYKGIKWDQLVAE